VSSPSGMTSATSFAATGRDYVRIADRVPRTRETAGDRLPAVVGERLVLFPPCWPVVARSGKFGITRGFGATRAVPVIARYAPSGYVRGHRVDKDATEWLSMQDEDGSFIHYKG
jgi:hypothetical protein